MYVDCHLQTIVKEMQSYARDTKDFLQKLNQIEEITEYGLIVTLDVKSLHTNIPKNEGIKAVKEAYDKHPNNFKKTIDKIYGRTE